MTKDEIYYRLKEAHNGGKTGSTCNTAAYVAGISKGELAHLAKTKLFSGANQVRFIIGKEVRNSIERKAYWERGVELLRMLGIPQQRQSWSDRPNEDFTDIQPLHIARKTAVRIISDSYLPSKEDFESAYRIKMLTRFGESISIDDVLDQIEINAKKEGHLLKNNWRMITEKNVEIWGKKS